MNMKTINVAEATGPTLDWLVAKALGHTPPPLGDFGTFIPWSKKMLPMWCGRPYRPSTDWAQGGSIIDRHDISVIRVYKDWPQPWLATHGEFIYVNADTPLIAAMRCYAVSRLGETVEVPEELA